MTRRFISDRQLLRIAKRNIAIMKATPVKASSSLSGRTKVACSSFTLFLMSFKGDKQTFKGLTLLQRGYRLGRIFNKLDNKTRQVLTQRAKSAPYLPRRPGYHINRPGRFVRTHFNDARYRGMSTPQRMVALMKRYKAERK